MLVLLVFALIGGAVWYIITGERDWLRGLLLPIVVLLCIVLLGAMAQHSTGDFTYEQAREHGERVFGTPTATGLQVQGEDY
jgi:hypothetical protein